jgi:hypothetical protein
VARRTSLSRVISKLTSRHHNDSITPMRTTLTLDEDVAVSLKRIAKRRGTSFKATVNDALRLGLDVLVGPPRPGEPYIINAWNLGGSIVGSLDNIEEVLSRIEGEDHA